METWNRRQFLRVASGAFAALGVVPTLARSAEKPGSRLRFGLVTYLWGAELDLPTLLEKCESAGVLGVELRTTHAHGVEPSLDEKEREAVRMRLEGSSVEVVGLGSNERFDSPDPPTLAKAIEATKSYLRLAHDIGTTGVKVKPDSFHKEVARELTIAQIGKSLRELAEYADALGQELRLEVHGQCAELPTIRKILDVADSTSVKICWNSNREDLAGEGIEANFRLVEKSLGRTLHVHELHADSYPYSKLFDLLVGIDYDGWVLLEASSKPADLVVALREQREIFEGLVAAAQARRA
jgi:sugar phosphate isomerase/epimerase